MSTESRNRLWAVTGELSVSATRRLGKTPAAAVDLHCRSCHTQFTILLKTAAFRSLIKKKDKSKMKQQRSRDSRGEVETSDLGRKELSLTVAADEWSGSAGRGRDAHALPAPAA